MAGPSLSEQLERALDLHEGGRVTLGDVVDLSDEHGFGLLFVVLSLPPFIPVLPWGTAAAIGAIFTALGLQRLSGRRRPWLPGRVRAMALSSRMARFMRERALPVLERLERGSARRLSVATSEPLSRLAAVSVAFMGLLMLSPLPFLNSLPALIVLVIGLGFLKGDGLYLLAGSVVGLALFAVVLALVAAGLLLL